LRNGRARLEETNVTVRRDGPGTSGELREKEQRLRMLMACSPVGIFRERQGRGRLHQRMDATITGSSAKSGDGFGWVERLHPTTAIGSSRITSGRSNRANELPWGASSLRPGREKSRGFGRGPCRSAIRRERLTGYLAAWTDITAAKRLREGAPRGGPGFLAADASDVAVGPDSQREAPTKCLKDCAGVCRLFARRVAGGLPIWTLSAAGGRIRAEGRRPGLCTRSGRRAAASSRRACRGLIQSFSNARPSFSAGRTALLIEGSQSPDTRPRAAHAGYPLNGGRTVI